MDVGNHMQGKLQYMLRRGIQSLLGIPVDANKTKDWSSKGPEGAADTPELWKFLFLVLSLLNNISSYVLNFEPPLIVLCNICPYSN